MQVSTTDADNRFGVSATATFADPTKAAFLALGGRRQGRAKTVARDAGLDQADCRLNVGSIGQFTLRQTPDCWHPEIASRVSGGRLRDECGHDRCGLAQGSCADTADWFVECSAWKPLHEFR